jgi:hypothetical protein
MTVLSLQQNQKDGLHDYTLHYTFSTRLTTHLSTHLSTHLFDTLFQRSFSTICTTALYTMLVHMDRLWSNPDGLHYDMNQKLHGWR